MIRNTNRFWAATMAALATLAMSLCTGCDALALELVEEVMSLANDSGELDGDMFDMFIDGD